MASSSFPPFNFTACEWDDQKNRKNIVKHGIDFEQALEIFYGDALLLCRSNRNNEERWLAIGETESRIIAVAFAWRNDRIRIISARRARKNEKQSYNQEKMGRKAEGQD